MEQSYVVTTGARTPAIAFALLSEYVGLYQQDFVLKTLKVEDIKVEQREGLWYACCTLSGEEI